MKRNHAPCPVPKFVACAFAWCAAVGLLGSFAEAVGGAPQADASPQLAVWANTGEDKVTRDDQRERRRDPSTHNSAWDGKRISLWGARNETVSFCLYLEAGDEPVEEAAVAFRELTHSSGARIASREVARDSLFDYRDQPIELFFVRYLAIKGISKLAYHHYDERHVPRRFRRPHDARGHGRGGWKDRPDHDKEYPDIAVPLALHPRFKIEPHTTQAVWCDVWIPRDTASGRYRGEAIITAGAQQLRTVPVELEVLDFALPELPTARTMLHVSTGDVCRRYLGEAWPHDYPLNKKLNDDARTTLDRHFQLAHRHRVSLIDDYVPIVRLESSGWLDRLSGALFAAERGYAGPGAGVGNNVFCIGAYGTTPKDELPGWAKWTAAQSEKTPTDYFVYLADESNDFAATNELIAGTPPGLRSLATLPAPAGAQETPRLSIVCSTPTVCETQKWEDAVRSIRKSGRSFWIYNGFRPASGTYCTEDDGVALREIAWGQFKMQVPRAFYWAGAYYNNYQGGTGQTNVFRTARTFGGGGQRDPSLGETGWNCNNGDGVLFYPGTDFVFPEESYGVLGPFTSLRLKHWRRGLQDFEYLTLAQAKDPAAVQAIVERMVPSVLWEPGVDNPSDPTYVTCDISWPTDPTTWEQARRELADIILRE